MVDDTLLEPAPFPIDGEDYSRQPVSLTPRIFIKDAMAIYRANRRDAGKDRSDRAPVTRGPRVINTDGHIPRNWFRTQIWAPAREAAAFDFHITPHGLRHAHASWLLAGGSDLQSVKERLGHGSIRTTERYLHTLEDRDDESVDILGASGTGRVCHRRGNPGRPCCFPPG
jgi:integrase